ncbi:MAG: NAD-dependent epimerase/dehydratase family protein [Deltaproteobacteria bacterium]|nr:NAD-dependent epimerase/dehydratase family protein [Deltaproteobacteria bacterium]
MGSVIQEDIENIAKSELPWEKLQNSSVLVTGASGLIGNLILLSLSTAARVHNLNLSLYGTIHHSKPKPVHFVEYISQDIRQPIEFNKTLDYIIHCAAVTNSTDMIKYPVENLKTSVLGTENILSLAKNKSCKSIVYLSSMEVYGVIPYSENLVTEDQLGFINLFNPRSCYPEGKRLCEMLCYAYWHEYKVPVKIARLSQTFGPGVSPNDKRVFMQFAQSVIDKNDIVLHTDGYSYGNYCYTSDTARAILLLLLEGHNGEAYNICNEDSTMTIKDMADLVANKIAGNSISVAKNITSNNITGYAPKSGLRLSSQKLRLLGWTPEYNLEDAYRRMLSELIEQKENQF